MSRRIDEYDDYDCRDGRNVYLPTEEEIRRECERLQRTWSAYERLRRTNRHYRPETPYPPEV